MPLPRTLAAILAECCTSVRSIEVKRRLPQGQSDFESAAVATACTQLGLTVKHACLALLL